jgi:hypothetical protein
MVDDKSEVSFGGENKMPSELTTCKICSEYYDFRDYAYHKCDEKKLKQIIIQLQQENKELKEELEKWLQEFMPI